MACEHTALQKVPFTKTNTRAKRALTCLWCSSTSSRFWGGFSRNSCLTKKPYLVLTMWISTSNCQRCLRLNPSTETDKQRQSFSGLDTKSSTSPQTHHHYGYQTSVLTAEIWAQQPLYSTEETLEEERHLEQELLNRCRKICQRSYVTANTELTWRSPCCSWFKFCGTSISKPKPKHGVIGMPAVLSYLLSELHVHMEDKLRWHQTPLCNHVLSRNYNNFTHLAEKLRELDKYSST